MNVFFVVLSLLPDACLAADAEAGRARAPRTDPPPSFQIACSNGQLGFGRRRRGIDSRPNDPNKIFEVTMMTYLKVDENLNKTSGEGTHAKALRESVEESLAFERSMTLGSSAPVPEEPLLIQSSGDEPSFIFFSAGHTHVPSALFVVASALLLLFYH